MLPKPGTIRGDCHECLGLMPAGGHDMCAERFIADYYDALTVTGLQRLRAKKASRLGMAYQCAGCRHEFAGDYFTVIDCPACEMKLIHDYVETDLMNFNWLGKTKEATCHEKN